MKRHAFITGISGQMGSYLAEWLLERDYHVFGLVRRTSTERLSRLHSCLNQLTLLEGDMTDESSLRRALLASRPHEIYNLAAQSHVGESFLIPLTTLNVTGMGALKLFETVHSTLKSSDGVRIYQASSSEMFGNTEEPMQTEYTPFRPVSPYGCAKTFAHYAAHMYCQSYALYISCGIAFNHESPRRGETFVTRKITKAVAQIQAGQLHHLRLGNVSARRDWSHAKDVAMGAWLSLQPPKPDDYVFASGISHSVEEFAEAAFNVVGLNPSDYVITEPSLFRPTDIQTLCGVATKARRHLGWEPTYTFQQLVEEMVKHDLADIGLGHSVSSV